MNSYNEIPVDCRDCYLTPREKQIVELLVQGLQPKEIAKMLGLKPKTVVNELSRGALIHMKANRYTLVYKAYRMGILSI